MRQHVHDNDLKALFFDFQHRLALKRYEEDDAAARSVVQALVLLCVLMPFVRPIICVGASWRASSERSCSAGHCPRSRRLSNTLSSRGQIVCM